MKGPTILYNIAIAVFMTVLALLSRFVMQHIFNGTLVTAMTLSLLTVIYIIHLLVKSKLRVGKITLGLFCLTALTSALLVKADLGSLLLISVGLIWVARSILYYSSLLSVLADFSLCVASLASALWGFFISGSFVAAIWCFFLTQALSAFIPRYFNCKSRTEIKPEKNRFNRAYQSAETAIRHLAQK